MLIRRSAEADVDYGEFVLDLLASRDWIRRRVETITFLDYRTLQRRVTLDLSMKTVAEIRDKHKQEIAKSTVVPDGDRVPLPLTMLRKGLLSDFNIRDSQGNAMPIATRSEDSHLAWCAFSAEMKRHGVGENLPESVEYHLRSIIENFPHASDSEGDSELQSWEPHKPWDSGEEQAWIAVRDNPECNRLLRDLTFNFMLITSLPADSGPHVIKFSYHEGFDIGSFGRGARVIFVDAPAVGWTRSCHMQFEDPEGLQVLDLALVRIGADVDREASGPVETEHYHAKVSETRTQIYAGPIQRANYLAVLYMRPRVPGLLRASWLSSLFTLVVLTSAVIFRSTITGSAGNADALAALLLIVPSTLAAYLVRPGEHDLIASAMLRVRFAMMTTALFAFIAASIVALGVGAEWIWRIVGPFSILSALPALWLTILIASTWLDDRRGRREIGVTQKDEVDSYQAI